MISVVRDLLLYTERKLSNDPTEAGNFPARLEA